MKKPQTECVKNFLLVLHDRNSPLEKNMQKLQILYENANIDDKKSIWRIPFGESLRSDRKEALLNLLEKDPALKGDEVVFYNDYIASIKKTSGNYLATEWFLNKTSNKWLLKETEFIPFLFRSFIGHIDPNNSFSRVKKALINKLEGLTKEDYEEFLEKNIKIAHPEIKKFYMVFILGFGSPEKIAHLYKLYKNEYPKSLHGVGIGLILRKDMGLVNQYKDLVINGLNKSIDTVSHINKIGTSLNVPLLQFIFDNYEGLITVKRERFIAEILTKAISFYNSKNLGLNNKERDMFDVVFDVNKKTPEHLPNNTILFLLFRVLLNFSKANKDYCVGRLLDHSKEVGQYEYIRKVMLVGSVEEVKFNRKRLNMDNPMVRGYCKDFLYQDLMEDLESKPTGKKMKI